jgi:hypothetical protein
VDIIKLLQELTAQLTDVAAATDAIANENYTRGFDAGIASLADKLYTQAELDKAIAVALEGSDGVTKLREELRTQYAEVEAQIQKFAESLK